MDYFIKKFKILGLIYYLKNIFSFLVNLIICIFVIIISPLINIRFCILKTKWLGAFIQIPELTILEKNFFKKNKCIDIYIRDTSISNTFYYNKIKKKINIFPKFFFHSYEIFNKLSKRNNFFSKFIFYRVNQGAFDYYDLMSKNDIIFNITKDEIKKGDEILKKKIPSNNNGIVLLCCRDAGYYSRYYSEGSWDYLDYRNYDINIFNETIDYLVNKKYIVLRMGKHSDQKINFINEYFIDYINCDWNSDFMDYYLAHKSKFCITTNTGMDCFARLHRKPIASIFFPLEDIYYSQKNVYNLSGTFTDLNNGKSLNLKEIFRNKLHKFSVIHNFYNLRLNKKFKFKYNNSSEIRKFIEEVDRRIDSRYVISENDDINQRKFWKIFFEMSDNFDDPLFKEREIEKICNFSYSYLRDNKEFLN